MLLFLLNLYYFLDIVFVFFGLFPLALYGAYRHLLKGHKREDWYWYLRNALTVFIVCILVNHLFFITKPYLEVFPHTSATYWILGTVQFVYFILMPFLPMVLGWYLYKEFLSKKPWQRLVSLTAYSYVFFALVALLLVTRTCVLSGPVCQSYVMRPQSWPNLISIIQLFDPLMLLFP